MVGVAYYQSVIRKFSIGGEVPAKGSAAAKWPHVGVPMTQAELLSINWDKYPMAGATKVEVVHRAGKQGGHLNLIGRGNLEKAIGLSDGVYLRYPTAATVSMYATAGLPIDDAPTLGHLYTGAEFLHAFDVYEGWLRKKYPQLFAGNSGFGGLVGDIASVVVAPVKPVAKAVETGVQSVATRTVNTVKAVGSDVVDAAKKSVQASAKVVQDVASKTVASAKDLAKGDIGKAVSDNVSGAKAALVDQYHGTLAVAQDLNDARKVVNNAITPAPVMKIENQLTDALNKFLTSKAGAILGKILQFVPVTAPFAWIYETAQFVAMAEDIRKMYSTIESTIDRMMLERQLAAKAYVYDDTTQALRLAHDGEQVADGKTYRYVPAKAGFVQVKNNQWFGSLLGLGTLFEAVA